MNVLEKILEEMDTETQKQKELCKVLKGTPGYRLYEKVASVFKGIVEKHMDEVVGDGWIPVSERFPELEEIVLVTVHTSEWISDCSSKHVPDDQKVHHPEEYGTYIGYVNRHGEWRFWGETMGETYCDKEFGPDKSDVYNVVTAWQPLLEPYKGGE